MPPPGAQERCETTVRRSSPGGPPSDMTQGFHCLLWIAAQRRGVRQFAAPARGAGRPPEALLSERAGRHLHLPHDTEVSTLPNALVTGSPERISDIAIALKSAGFDILAAGLAPDEAPDLDANSVDCWVQLPVDGPLPRGGALRRTREFIAHEMLTRFDAAARFLPLLAPGGTVVLVTEGAHPENSGAGLPDPDQPAPRTLVGVLAEAIVRD